MLLILLGGTPLIVPDLPSATPSQAARGHLHAHRRGCREGPPIKWRLLGFAEATGRLGKNLERGRGWGAKRLPPAGTASQVRANRETVFQTDADLVPAPCGGPGGPAARWVEGKRAGVAPGGGRGAGRAGPEGERGSRVGRPASPPEGNPGTGKAREVFHPVLKL